MTARGFVGQGREQPSKIPTLQNLLRVCDRSLLKRVIIEEFADPSNQAGKRGHHLMSRRLDSSLDTMCSMPVVPGVSCGWALVPRESYSLEPGSLKISRRICTDLVPHLSEREIIKLLDLTDGAGFSYKKAKKALRSMKKHSRSATLKTRLPCAESFGGERSYIFEPWEEILACSVWLEGSWCCKERYLALAGAFWEMTFLGFEYDKVQAKRALLDAGQELVQHAKRGDNQQDCIDPLKAEKKAHRRALVKRDAFDGAYQNSLAKKVAILNHHAGCDFLESRIKLAQQIKRG